jgi:hypothetical protein
MERQPDKTPPAAPAKKPPAREDNPEQRLDEGLKETFPTSDPVSVSVPAKEREWTAEELAEAERKRRADPTRAS